MKESDVILAPLFQSDEELKYRPVIVLREMPIPSFSPCLSFKTCYHNQCHNSLSNPITKQFEITTPHCSNTINTTSHTKARSVPLFDNIFFQNPQHGILYQNGEQVFDVDLTDPTRLITALQHLFAAPPAALANWHTAVAEFKEKVPALGKKAAELIAEQYETNPRFVAVFTDFYEQCRAAINPTCGYV